MTYTSLQFLTTAGDLGRMGVASIEFVSGARNVVGPTAVEFAPGMNS